MLIVHLIVGVAIFRQEVNNMILELKNLSMKVKFLSFNAACETKTNAHECKQKVLENLKLLREAAQQYEEIEQCFMK